MEKKQATIKSTLESLRLLRIAAAATGERQYDVLERLLRAEIARLRESGDLP